MEERGEKESLCYKLTESEHFMAECGDSSEFSFYLFVFQFDKFQLAQLR